MERKAFDVEAYRKADGFNRRGFVADLANVSLEASENLANHESVIPIKLEITSDGKLVNPDLGPQTDIAEYFSYETPLDMLESAAGESMRESFLGGELGEICIWISPPGGELNYLDGRMTAGWTKLQYGRRVVEAYGIKHDFSGEESVRIANRLAYFSKERKVFADPEELRDQVLKISMQNYQENPVEFLANHIDMPRVWEAIATGEVRENYHKAATVAENIGKYAEELIHFGYSASYVGAVAENYMRSNGYQLEDFACGRLNSSILNSTGMGVVYKSELLGGIRLVGLEGKFVKKCPYPDCDREINKVIHRGYKCKCGRVYKAVC